MSKLSKLEEAITNPNIKDVTTKDVDIFEDPESCAQSFTIDAFNAANHEFDRASELTQTEEEIKGIFTVHITKLINTYSDTLIKLEEVNKTSNQKVNAVEFLEKIFDLSITLTKAAGQSTALASRYLYIMGSNMRRLGLESKVTRTVANNPEAGKAYLNSLSEYKGHVALAKVYEDDEQTQQDIFDAFSATTSKPEKGRLN